MNRILIVSPAPPDEQLGNAITASRWAKLLAELGHHAPIVTEYAGEDCDALVALHARRSASSIERFARERPDRPLLVALTGTDLYPDIASDPIALGSLARATRLIALHDRAHAALPAEFRDRVRVIFQSVEVDHVRPRPPAPGFPVCVMGHLRPVKDPFLAARAARLLPPTSEVTIVHLGRALTPDMDAEARAESASNGRYDWRGERPRAEALEMLAGSRLHVLTSTHEGGANAVSEAIALGVPTLSTEIDGSIGLLGDDYPGYFPIGDAPALAALLRRAEASDAFTKELREACARRAPLFATARELEAWRALLLDLDLPTNPRTEPPAMSDDRLSLLGDAPTDTLAEFREDVGRGLSRSRKSISCRWFYDATGSALFEQICDLKEYYPTRAEEEILRERADEIVDLLPPHSVCIELGSGSSVKTRRLFDAFFRVRDRLRYVPIDISPTALESSARALLDDYEQLSVTGIVGEYERGFEWMARQSDQDRLVLWLGSNVGNFDRGSASKFLRALRGCMTLRDHLLLGVDLRKDAAVLEAAYDDPGGVTARFNLNVLERINRELDADFDLTGFRHEAVYDVQDGRVSMNLVSQRAQSVHVAGLGLDLDFADGERIHTEDSYKYSPEEIDELAASSGFEVERRWLDRASRFSVNLFRPCE